MRRSILIPLLLVVVVAYGGLVATLVSGSSPELGLDLQGGVSVVLAPTGDATDDQLDQSVAIVRDRVDALGVAEPDITRQGDAIVVQLPGVKNRDRALALVGRTAELRFRPVLRSLPLPADDVEAAREAVDVRGEGARRQPPGDAGVPPLTSREADTADAAVTLPGLPGSDAEAGTTVVYQLGPALATGRIVRTASADLQNGQWLVRLEMRGGDDGIDKFNDIAARCYAQQPDLRVCPSGQLAIVLDSVVQSAPRITQPSYEADQIQISGSFTERQAKDLALVLRYGSLPVELERQSVQTVSASLGDDSLHAGILAGVVGLAVVAVYMLLYYRALGLVVIVGLSVWGALMYSIVTVLGQTWGLALTLSGVTGIIVSIGVTVDSYVVYFERLKDEVKAGRTLRSSTDKAFKRAFRTILAANFTSFLAALVLWWLTVGSVRGFAFFLGLSTLLDVVVAWAFTHPVVVLLSRRRLFTDMPFLGVARGLAPPPGGDVPAAPGPEGRRVPVPGGAR
ncbi:MAG TPA: protein translocase subunit SecD [Acidimicrobiales bacterium]|nr:protein translocase subunit SecD [Acidimicrobiales bacterium]